LRLLRVLTLAWIGYFASAHEALGEQGNPLAMDDEPSLSLTPPTTKAEVEQLIQGKWRQISWRPLDSGDDYNPYSAPVKIYKVYAHGSYFLFNYGTEGQVWEFYGGQYEVLDNLRIRETIGFYSPESNTKLRVGSGGQLVYEHRKTMVGGVYEYTVRIASDGSQLYQAGRQTQNTREVANPENYGDFDMDNGYIKIHD